MPPRPRERRATRTTTEPDVIEGGTAAAKRGHRAAAVALALALLAACGRDAPPRPPAMPGAQSAKDVPVVPDLEPPPVAARWQPPPVSLEGIAPAQARRRAEAALSKGRLFEDADAAIPLFLALLARDPADTAAQAGLSRALDALLHAGDDALADADDDADALHRAQQIAAVVRGVGARRVDDGEAFLARTARAEQLWALNDDAERALAADRLDGAPDAALPIFRKVLGIAPGQARAMQGVAAIESTMLRHAEEAALGSDFEQAEHWLAAAAQVRPGFDTAQAGRAQVELIRSIRIGMLRDEGIDLLVNPGARNHMHDARDRLTQLLRIARPGDPAAKELRARIELAAHYGVLHPGERFADPLKGGGHGPDMVVVPHGGFRMGARDGDADAPPAERPSRYVRFERGFAIARTEVTVGEFRQFIVATGYRPRAVRRGHSFVYDDRAGSFVRHSGVDWRDDYLGHPAADDMPVLHVNAKDAEAYAKWLGDLTGQHYRLPSEAEFEYALRAGQTGRYPWGDAAPKPGAGNFTGSADRSPGGRRWDNAFAGYRDGYWGPAPVARFRANAFGIHDLEGNVSEWTADCWHDGYRRAPTQGEAWVNPGCRTRVVRGGAWSNAPAQIRAAWRRQADADSTTPTTGFRVVRDL